jgi:hypothetical protein
MLNKIFKKQLITIALFSCILALCVSAVGYAYTFYNKPIQSTNTLTFTLHSGYSTTSNQHFSDAKDRWNTAAGRNYLAKSTATHSYTNYPNNDGVNLVYRVNTGSPTYLAEVQPYNSGNYVVSADINLNMYFSWANSAQPGYYDVGTAFLHELGHVMGLGHSTNINAAAMYPTQATNVAVRYLGTDDENGIKAIY